MFKRIFLLLLFPFLASGQEVQWESSLKSAFEKAAATQKTIFIEFYSPTCPYCQRIEPFFNEKQVADLYNNGFINYKLSMDTDEGQQFYEDINLDVFGIPYFLFFRPDSTLVHAREVSASVNSVLQPGQMVLADTYAAWNYPQRFEQGTRTENFLAQYAIFSRVQKDIGTNRKVVDALWQVYPENKKNTRSSWIMVKKAVMDTDNGFVDFWLGNLELAESFEADNAYQDASDTFMRVFLNTIESDRAKEFNSVKWQSLLDRFSPALGEDATLGLIWEKMARALSKEGRKNELKNLGNKLFDSFQGQPESLQYLISVFMEVSEDTEQLNSWQKQID